MDPLTPFCVPACSLTSFIIQSTWHYCCDLFAKGEEGQTGAAMQRVYVYSGRLPGRSDSDTGIQTTYLDEIPDGEVQTKPEKFVY